MAILQSNTLIYLVETTQLLNDDWEVTSDLQDPECTSRIRLTNYREDIRFKISATERTVYIEYGTELDKYGQPSIQAKLILTDTGEGTYIDTDDEQYFFEMGYDLSVGQLLEIMDNNMPDDATSAIAAIEAELQES